MACGHFPNNPMARTGRGKIMAFRTTTFMEPAVDHCHSALQSLPMIGLLTMKKSLVEGPFHLATKVVADHQLITRVLIVNPSGDTMTTTVVVRQATMKTARMNLYNRPAQTNLLVKIIVAMMIVCSLKTCTPSR